MNTKKINSDGKSFWYWVLFLALITTGIFSFGVMNEQEKKYKVELTLKEWQDVVYCLQQSNEPSIVTNKYVREIGSQVDPIAAQDFQAEQKKIQDSLNKKPKQ